MPRILSVLLTVALATIACNRADDSNARRSSTQLAAGPAQKLEGELFMRIEGSPDIPSLVVESVVAADDRLLFPTVDNRVVIYEPAKLRLLDLPAGMNLFAVHDDDLLFFRTGPGAVRLRRDFGTRTIYALAESGGEPHELATFEATTTPLLIGDAIVAITEQNRVIHRAIAGGETRVGPQAPGTKPIGTPDVRGDGLVRAGVSDEASYVAVSRAPFDRVEVAVEQGSGGVVVDAAWAGDDSIVYSVVGFGSRLQLSSRPLSV